MTDTEILDYLSKSVARQGKSLPTDVMIGTTVVTLYHTVGDSKRRMSLRESLIQSIEREATSRVEQELLRNS